MPNITPSSTPQRPAKRQNTGSVHYSTPVRNNTTATAGFSTPVTTPVNTQQATQLTSPPKLEQPPKECVTLEAVFSRTLVIPSFGNSPDRNNLQPRPQNNNIVPDNQNP